MAKILAPPEFQAIDDAGHPYAGGTLTMCVPGTDTPKDTWRDHEGKALNTNPVILDAAGRCILFGEGEYRMVLRDAAGTLVYDGWTTSLVSTAMQPVFMAATIAEADRLLGVGDISVETARAEAAEAAIQDGITAETTRAEAAEALLDADIAAETARAIAAETALNDALTHRTTTGTNIRVGETTSDSSGNITVTFEPAFPTECILFLVGDQADAMLAALGGIPGITWPGSMSKTGVTTRVVDTTPAHAPLADWNVGWWALGL